MDAPLYSHLPTFLAQLSHPLTPQAVLFPEVGAPALPQCPDRLLERKRYPGCPHVEGLPDLQGRRTASPPSTVPTPWPPATSVGLLLQ